MIISAEASNLLPQAFPQLRKLRVDRCKHDTAALLKALWTCKHLTHLALENPRGAEQNPDGLWAAAVATAEAAGERVSLLEAVATMRTDYQFPVGPEGKITVAVGALLSQFSHLTTLELRMPRVLTAARLFLPGPLPDTLQSLDLCETGSRGNGQPISYGPAEISALLTTVPLSQFQSLRSLELSIEAGTTLLLPYLVGCPTVANLSKLSLPCYAVDLEQLDLMLQKLPGGR